MRSIACTLFENDYQYGVASLINSLYYRGLKGEFYVGYRGELPKWVFNYKCQNCNDWSKGLVLTFNSSLKVYFLPLSTDYHLTNYKPDFMLQIWSIFGENKEGIFYFDPDIVLTAPWSYLEAWVEAGIALCEDVNSPLEKNHPRRVAWRKYYKAFGITLSFKNSVYVNGGFIGLHRNDINFLLKWKEVQELMAPVIGGLNRSKLTGTPLPAHASGPFAPFSATDQDALNVAIEAVDNGFSFMHKEAMGFAEGLMLMSHALGVPKPWNKNYFLKFFSGHIPTKADRGFWENSNGSIIELYSKSYYYWKNTIIKMLVALGRFYSK